MAAMTGGPRAAPRRGRRAALTRRVSKRKIRRPGSVRSLPDRHSRSGPSGARSGPTSHLPFFCSDLFDLGYEAAGVLDLRLEVVADWEEPCRRGIVYYVGRR